MENINFGICDKTFPSTFMRKYAMYSRTIDPAALGMF